MLLDRLEFGAEVGDFGRIGDVRTRRRKAGCLRAWLVELVSIVELLMQE